MTRKEKNQKIKRHICLILAFALLAAAAPFSASAVEVGGQNVIFTIINNDLAPLRSDTMPVIVDSSLYVPYSVFTSNFDIVSIYNSRDELLILSDSSKTLFFDLKNGGCFDRDDQSYQYSTVVRSGLIYVPAVFVARTFSLVCAYYSEQSTVRIKDINSSYSDKFLLTVLAEDRENALKEYEIAVMKEQDPEIEPFDVYISFSGAFSENTADFLDLLDQLGIKAAFFVTKEDILQYEDLIRRIYVSGHTIGLALSGTLPQSAEFMTSQFDEAQDALDRVLNIRSRLVCVPDGSANTAFTDEHRQALYAGGYRYWDALVSTDGIDLKRSTERITEALCDKLKNTTGNTVLGLHYDQPMIAVLPEICRFFVEHQCTVLRIEELTAPKNFHADLW